VLGGTFALRFDAPAPAEQPPALEGVWTRRSVEDRPEPRHGHAMVHAPQLGGVLLHGGSSSEQLGDLWRWDGQAWTLLSTEGPSRSLHGLAYDPRRQRLVVYGGLTHMGRTPRSDSEEVWEWDGARWLPENTDLAFHFARQLAREANPAGKANISKAAFARGVETYARAARTFATEYSDWDRDELLLNTPGGTVDLRTGRPLSDLRVGRRFNS